MVDFPLFELRISSRLCLHKGSERTSFLHHVCCLNRPHHHNLLQFQVYRTVALGNDYFVLDLCHLVYRIRTFHSLRLPDAIKHEAKKTWPHSTTKRAVILHQKLQRVHSVCGNSYRQSPPRGVLFDSLLLPRPSQCARKPLCRVLPCLETQETGPERCEDRKCSSCVWGMPRTFLPR